MKKIINKIVTSSTLVLISATTLAADNGGITTKIGLWTSTIDSIGEFAYVIAFLIGLFLAISGLINIKKYADNPQQNPLTKPLIYFLVGAFLMGLTAWNTMMGESVTGGDVSDRIDRYDKL